MNYFIGTGGMSGISLAIDVFISLYAFSIYRDEEQSPRFWKAVFYTIMISTFIATIYGIFNETAHDKWIRGLGYVSVFTGTIGTARMGMYFCVSLIYPVFYIKKRIFKVATSIILSLGAIMTSSVTTLVCFLLFWVVVLIFKSDSNTQWNVMKAFVFLFSLIVVIFLWTEICQISFIKPLVSRINSIIEALEEGDMQTATSSRSYLMIEYINDFREYGLINKLFGSFYINRFYIVSGYSSVVENYAHNSFIDILLYTGILGTTAYAIKILMRLSFLINREEFLPILLLKSIFVITGLSVSMLTNSYWPMWILI